MSGRPHDDHARADRHAELARLEHVFVAHDDVSLHVVRSRPWDRAERRAPVLFLHGYPDTSDTWSLQLASLGQTHPVAAFDQRGVGRSSAPTGPKGYAFARHLGDIEAVIDELTGPEGQVHLVAHDWGGALAWMFAEQPKYARRLRSLSVIAGPHPSLMLRRVARAVRSPRELRFLFDQLRKSWYIFFFQLPWLPEQFISRQFPETWIRALRAGGVAKDDPLLREFDVEGTRRAALAPLALYRQIPRYRPTLRPVEVPTCLIVPLRDFALRPEIYDDVPEVAADLEVHRLDANHWAHRERAAEVSAILEAFVRRVEHDS
ncbi:alpha/beta fold hydrolase [Nannocystis sp. SCPEA4]|uniref:alpha/beta fold hydrolase n=1 Tax=Nannocystis sp. SCPEA4 TaxID=2996787 RepID=UPI0022701BBA|nr:alpha/beta fold hydrolase [Nannocystis sp. SCPEA4]MCY1056471.1 alpha/beta fold hydrolase [Nannocystis sp. SCPEA4]